MILLFPKRFSAEMIRIVESVGIVETVKPVFGRAKSVETVKPFRIVDTVGILRHVMSVWSVDPNVNLSLVLTILTDSTQQTLLTFQGVSTVPRVSTLSTIHTIPLYSTLNRFGNSNTHKCIKN